MARILPGAEKVVQAYARFVSKGTALPCPCASSEEGQRRSPHLQGRPGGTPPPRSGGGWVGAPLQKTPSSALSLPCEIVSISQGRPLLAPEFTKQGQEEAGKGLNIPVCGGSSLHATPFRQEAAVHWMPMGRGPFRPPPSCRRALA
jgi:hypothetical protein